MSRGWSRWRNASIQRSSSDRETCFTTASDASFGSAVAFYSSSTSVLTSCTRVSELRRVLVAGGRLLVAFHVGNEVRHVDELGARALISTLPPFRKRVKINALAPELVDVSDLIADVEGNEQASTSNQHRRNSENAGANS